VKTLSVIESGINGARLTHPPTPFANELRVRHEPPIEVASPGEQTIALRVEVPEVWDAVRFDVAPETTVKDLKVRALEQLYPDANDPGVFLMKLDGWEIRDESISVAEAGARDGSIFLLTFRPRRPVRV
jgi:hypothetical protein